MDYAKVEEVVTNQGVNVRDDGNGLAAIETAAKNGDINAVKLLLMEGEDVRSKKDRTLYIAAEEGHWKLVQWLLDYEAYGRVVFFNPVKSEEFLLNYFAKMMNNKTLQEKVSPYHSYIYFR